MLEDKVKERVEELGWSIKTTATRTGLHRDIVSLILNGKNTNPTLSTLQRLSKGLRMPIRELVKDYEYDHGADTDPRYRYSDVAHNENPKL